VVMEQERWRKLNWHPNFSKAFSFLGIVSSQIINNIDFFKKMNSLNYNGWQINVFVQTFQTYGW
jgi:hypothetical protein